MSKEVERPDIKDRAEKERDAAAIEKREQIKAGTPEQPDCDPALGDLTPAYIAWVKKYFPDDYEARYIGRIPELPEKKRKKFSL